MEHVSKTLNDLRNELFKARDSEIMAAQECGAQYITDHNDKAAWRDLDRSVNALARAWDKMIAKLEKWIKEAEAIESSVENFYGD